MLPLPTFLSSVSYFSTAHRVLGITSQIKNLHLNPSPRSFLLGRVECGGHIKTGLHLSWTAVKASNAPQPTRSPCSKPSPSGITKEDCGHNMGKKRLPRKWHQGPWRTTDKGVSPSEQNQSQIKELPQQFCLALELESTIDYLLIPILPVSKWECLMQ